MGLPPAHPRTHSVRGCAARVAHGGGRGGGPGVYTPGGCHPLPGPGGSRMVRVEGSGGSARFGGGGVARRVPRPARVPARTPTPPGGVGVGVVPGQRGGVSRDCST